MIRKQEVGGGECTAGPELTAWRHRPGSRGYLEYPQVPPWVILKIKPFTGNNASSLRQGLPPFYLLTYFKHPEESLAHCQASINDWGMSQVRNREVHFICCKVPSNVLISVHLQTH